MSAFMGMRGTGDWADNQVPESWAQYILYEQPNGSAPMFAMQSMFRKEYIDSHTDHWWTKTLPTQAAAVSGIYIDAGLSTAYVYATHQASHGAEGKMIYVNVSSSFANECKVGHTALLRDSDQPLVDVRGRIEDVFVNGSSSYIAVKLYEDDDNHTSPSTYNLSTVDRVLLIGSAYPEGSYAPDAINYNPVEYTNYGQEFRDTLDITDIAQAVVLRTGDAYKEAKRECAELHSIGIEKAGFFGQKYSGTGANGKPLRLAQGLIPFIHENVSDNVVDFKNDTGTDYAGKSWLEAGKKWLNTNLARLFRYSPPEMMAFCGDGALLAINELAETYGDIQLVGKVESYGITVTKWLTPFGILNLKTHPLFSHETTQQKMMVALHPKNVKFAALKGGGKNFDTQFEENMQIPGQHSKVDGYYTVGTWRFYFPNQFMVFYNVGEDNTAA